MTKAPERIVTRHYVNGIINARVKSEGFAFAKGNEVFTGEYVHIDHALALVAAAYEDAGDAAADVYDRRDLPTGADLAGYIRTIACDDAQAALNNLLQEARNEALKEAAEATQDVIGIKPFSSVADVKSIISKSILALITEDQSDE